MKRRVDSLADAVIRDARPVRLPDGTEGRLVGDWPEANGVRLVLIVDGRRTVTPVLPTDTLIEIGAKP